MSTILHPELGLTPVDNLCGWGGKTRPDLVKSAADNWGSGLGEKKKLHIVGAVGSPPQRVMLWELVRKVLGKDTDNYAQQIGDCVSFGMKNAMEYLQCVQMSLGQIEDFKSIFPPYIYGISRHQIGGDQLWGDGSNGSWAAQGVMKYGVISTDAPGCPAYSGSVAKSWGSRSGPPSSFIPVGQTHLVKSTAPVTSWDDLVTAISNGYPVTVASNVGYDMSPRSDGFNHYSTHWGHQMCIVGYDNGGPDDKGNNIEPHACILNSWGDVFGHITDFRTGLQYPVGTIRARRADIEAMIAEQDTWAISQFDGFPGQELPRSDFDLW